MCNGCAIINFFSRKNLDNFMNVIFTGTCHFYRVADVEADDCLPAGEGHLRHIYRAKYSCLIIRFAVGSFKNNLFRGTRYVILSYPRATGGNRSILQNTAKFRLKNHEQRRAVLKKKKKCF